MLEIVSGSVEYLPVKLSDSLGSLTTLDGHTVSFQVMDEAEANVITAWTVCSNNGMIALPLIDTTAMAEGIYKLFVKVDLTPEIPILGPIDFAVV